ncbi:MAG: ABC transporter permease, partial [Acidobacteriota bacterium]|nr:ABC transporter permease [Acidobacteriota bacterium]
AHVTTMSLVAPTRIVTAPERAVFFQQALERLAALPGVQAAGLVTRLPLRDGGGQGTMTIEDRPDLRDGREPNAFFRIISPGYLDAMGIGIIQGRAFTAADRTGALPVGIVSESFAGRMWPGQSPLGRRIRHTFGRDRPWVTIVGVAEETRLTRMTGDNPLVLYVPLAQAEAPDGPVLVVKGAGAAAPVPAIRAAVHELDNRIAVARVATLDAVVAAAVAEPLRLRFFLSVLGVLALVIGAVGIYSVVSYSVVRRRSEFGVRLALGASPRRILTDVITGGLMPVVIGVAAGVGCALALASTVGTFLYGVTSTDAPSLAGAAAALLAAGVLAATIPAVRAGRIDPVSALRAE